MKGTKGTNIQGGEHFCKGLCNIYSPVFSDIFQPSCTFFHKVHHQPEMLKNKTKRRISLICIQKYNYSYQNADLQDVSLLMQVLSSLK